VLTCVCPLVVVEWWATNTIVTCVWNTNGTVAINMGDTYKALQKRIFLVGLKVVSASLIRFVPCP
jgi:hypothetical protein